MPLARLDQHRLNPKSDMEPQIAQACSYSMNNYMPEICGYISDKPNATLVFRLNFCIRALDFLQSHSKIP
jgi:hypothetical protein